MDSFLNYLVEANIGLLIFLACYQFILRIETSYRFTRFFLLGGIFASVIFPLIHAQSNGEASILSIGEVLPSLSLSELTVDDSMVNKASHEAGLISSLWIRIYAAVSLLFAVAFISRLRTIIHKMVTAKTYRRGKFRICESETSQSTFSFFNFIFVGESHQLTPDEKEHILRHEMAHANHYHSIDAIAIQLLRVVFWFNPFLSAYKDAIVQTHEFHADAIATDERNADNYCRLLAKVSLRSVGFTFANHFNHSLTVKRIAMIRTVKDQISFWKMSICGVTLAAAFLLLSCEDQLRTADNDVLPTDVDEHAYPKEGMEQFYNEVKRNIRYPISARKNHSAGQVLVQFVVNEDGSVSDIEILESPDDVLAEEGRRMLSSLATEWIPAKKGGVAVKEQIVIPIKFKLDGVTDAGNHATQNEDAYSLGEIFVIGYTK